MTSPRKTRKATIADDEDRVIVVTSRGVRVECLAIMTQMEALEENIRAQFEWPDLPRHEVPTPPDADWDNTIPMTQEYVDLEDTPDEDRQEWGAYQIELARVDGEYDAKLTEARDRLFALRGVIVLDGLYDSDEWAKEQEWMGIKVPEHPLERKVHFFRTEVVGSQLDTMMIMKGCYRSAGFDKEVLDRFEDSFRTEMGRVTRAALERDQGPLGTGTGGEA